jgi:chemotaxis protein MotB
VGKKCPEFENHERWLISYADMLTLLFALFVCLYALKDSSSSSKKDEQNKAAGSLQEALGVPLEDIPIEQRYGPNSQGIGIFENFRGNRITPPVTPKFPTDTQRSKVIENEMDSMKARLEERLYGPNKHPEGSGKGEERIVSIHRDADGFRLRLLANAFFKPGITEPRFESRRELETLADLLKDLGRPIVVEGHTDATPSNGDMTNWELSALRATNVLKLFVRDFGFPQTKISASGYADTRPIAHNGTEQGRSMNRRVEIKVQYDMDTTPTLE